MDGPTAKGGTGRSLVAHLPEVAAVLLILLLVRSVGVEGVGAAWLTPTLLLLAVLVSASVYNRWGDTEDAIRVHLRVALQATALTALAVVSGAGSALVGPVLLLAVADTIRYSGSQVGRLAVGWALAGILVHQVVVEAFALPTVLPGRIGHGVAALGAAVVVLVGGRIGRLAEDSERARDRLVDEQARVRAMLAGASDVTMIIGDGEITFQSPSTQNLLGYPDESMVGRRYLDLVHPDDRASVIAFVQDLLQDAGSSGLVACRLECADGTYLPVESSCRNLLDDPAVRGFVVTSRDVSERQELQAQLAHRAFHDDLTGLANRSLLLDRLQHTGERCARTGDRYAVLYVDLDGFKPINDTFGHVAGDAVLVAVARRLVLATRRSDTVARLGGDEFAVLLEGQGEEVDAARVASRILDELRRPILADGADVTVTASIGIAYDADGDEASDVLRNADIAMYLAKRDGKDRFEVFEPEMHIAVVERLHLESDLAHALEDRQLTLHYQPIVTLEDRRVVGVEALVRWEHPERGLVSPGQFIPLAEETGLILGIGRFVLHEACRQVADWRRDVPGASDLSVSVNVSMRQLALGDLLGDVRSALAGSGLPPKALTLELTESALVHDTEGTLTVLRQLKELGVRLAVDDFGTGYSSLAYLHRFPVDELKIDRSFVTSVVSGRQSPALARAIVDLGRSLDLITVAEGIEHDAELTQFRELDCALGQGYLFARPAAPERIVSTLSEAFEQEAFEDETITVAPEPDPAFDAGR